MSVRRMVPPALLLCCFLARASASEAPSSLIIEHGAREGKQIALTFDACPTGTDDEYDGQVIGVLERENVPATLFLSGRWVEKNAARVRDLAARSQFEFGNHAYWHPHLTGKDDERVLRELKRTQTIIRKATGQRPQFFRPPFGEVDERVAKLAEQAGLVTVQYDIASGDPDPKLAPERITRAVLRDARGGSIIVFHMNRRGPHTAEVLPAVIAGLRQKGYELVTVGTLLRKADLRRAADARLP
jgi:peptidoglycan/xylan/chitin deacetylase (PgdA/CDA1 family)